MSDAVSRETSPLGDVSRETSAAITAAFGERRGLAEGYAALLADTGVTHGLIGPREVPRLWERHLLNCAAIAPALPSGAAVADVGSGAGLPGLVLAIARPDVQMHLVEPLLRRTTWLASAVETLGLDNVIIHRGRADEVATDGLRVDVVTARAVARLATLAAWCRPLLHSHGVLVAMKGRSAAEELAEDEPSLRRLGLKEARLVEREAPLSDEPVRTVELTFHVKR